MPQPSWMAFAWADLGRRETVGPAANPHITAYFKRVGHAEITDDATPWCAAYVGAALERAGIPSTRSLLARSYLTWGQAIDPPELGAVVVLSRGSDPTFGHVGFLVGTSDDRVFLLGGNQGDAVGVAAFDRNRVLGFRMPLAASRAPADAATPEPLQRSSGEPPLPLGFAAAVAHVLAFEGGWSDDPFDPGGPTNKGITLADYARELGEPVTAETFAILKQALKSIPDGLVEQIYLRRYWRPACCDDLPPALAFFHFDAAVNQGVGTAARMLQQALQVSADGEIGPETLGAASAAAPETVLARYAAIRRARYRELAQFWRFGRGWLRRLDATLARATAQAATLPPPLSPPSPSLPADPPQETETVTDTATSAPTIADEPRARPAPVPSPSAASPPAPSPPAPSPPAAAKWWGESLTIWGALLTGASTVAPALFAVLGIDMPSDLIQRLGQDVVLTTQAVMGLAGTVMTILGRVRARAPLQRRALSVKL